MAGWTPSCSPYHWGALEMSGAEDSHHFLQASEPRAPASNGEAEAKEVPGWA